MQGLYGALLDRICLLTIRVHLNEGTRGRLATAEMFLHVPFAIRHKLHSAAHYPQQASAAVADKLAAHTVGYTAATQGWGAAAAIPVPQVISIVTCVGKAAV